MVRKRRMVYLSSKHAIRISRAFRTKLPYSPVVLAVRLVEELEHGLEGIAVGLARKTVRWDGHGDDDGRGFRDIAEVEVGFLVPKPWT